MLPAWRGSRAVNVAVITTRLLSALISAPVFVAADAPTWAQVAVGAAITATAIAVWLQAAALRRQPATAST